MKLKLIITLVAFFIISQMYSQHSSKCSHKSSFEKSWISDTLDALSYTIQITAFDFTNHIITAHTDVELASKIDNLAQVYLELMDLTVDEVKIDGTIVPNFQHNEAILTIPLATAINTGEIITVSVAYHGTPFHEAWGGFHWSGNYAFNLGVGFVSIPHNLGKTWFPCIDDFHDRALYTVYATVPIGMDAIGGGLLEEVINNGNGTSTFKWAMNQTIPTYLASVAVGDYAKWTDTYNGINSDIPVEIWVRPVDSVKVDGSFQNLNAILALFEEKFGPYRFDRVGYVGTAIGAMEHATNIAYPHSLITGNLTYESYIAHELSHMWFGDNVTCATAEDMWLNEGWAVFADALYQEALYGEAQYKEFIRTKHKGIIQFCHTASGDGSYFPLNQIPQEYTYGMTAYDRGATVAHTLRGYIGDDLFFDAMAAYNEYFKFNHASSEDLRDLLTSETGLDMTGWFDNWVFHSGTPHYSIDSFSVAPNGSGADVTVYLRQKRHGPAFIGNANRIEVSFLDHSWNRFDHPVQFDGETASPVFSVPFLPELVAIDLNEKMCDAITDYTLIVKQTGVINCANSFFKLDVQSISDSAFVRVEHNWAPPDGLKTPVQGLMLSPYRYWKIDGILPDDFEAQGVFMYNKNGFLDDGLLINPTDSIVILYRQSPAADWQFIPFTKVGPYAIGNLYVENLQMGEYTFAVCDDTFVGLKEFKNNNGSGLLIYPNPSNGKFNIDTNQPGYLKFYDVSGKLLASHRVDDPTKTFIWEPEYPGNGTILIEFQSLNLETIATEKLILKKNNQ
jgi:aminopeptidase N